MHSCLHIIEILYQILSHLNNLTPKTGGHQAIAALSQTCKALHGPAIAVLWSRLKSFGPCWNLLPAASWKLVDGASGRRSRRMVLTRELNLDDLKRFSYYAILVSSFVVRERQIMGPVVAVDPQVFVGISRTLGTNIIFPNTRRLSWNWSEGSLPSKVSSCIIDHFLGPNLLSVSCMPTLVDDTFTSSRITTLAPTLQLQELHFQMPASRKLEVIEISPQLCELITHLPKLKRLDFQRVELPHGAFYQVFTDPRIEGLAFSTQNVNILDLLRQTPPKIRQLFLESTTASTISNFFPLASPLILETLEITLRSLWIPDDELERFSSQLSAAITESCSIDHMKKLKFILQFWDANVSADAIQPLLAFCNLTHFEFAGVRITRGFLKEIGRCWPKIQSLQLRDVASSGPSFSLTDLVELAQQCTMLTTLIMELDASTAANATLLAAGPQGVINRNLRYIELGGEEWYNVEDPKAIAGFLKVAFPALAFHGSGDWVEVNCLKGVEPPKLYSPGAPLTRFGVFT